ncbi:MAG: cytochrome c [Pseudomonadales bacterium]
MFSPERVRLLVAVAMLSSAACAADALAADRAGPGLGEAVDADTLAAASLTVYPDGAGLPPGRGDARAGAVVYAAHCLACHGPGGRGGVNDALVGGHDTLAGAAPQRTVGSFWPYATTVFDYVRRAMPYPAPGSLSTDQVYAVTAYLLAEHGIIDADTVLDAETLPAVVMPNRDGFLLSPRRP